MVTFLREAFCDVEVEIVVVDKVPSNKGRVRSYALSPLCARISVFEMYAVTFFWIRASLTLFHKSVFSPIINSSELCLNNYHISVKENSHA